MCIYIYITYIHGNQYMHLYMRIYLYIHHFTTFHRTHGEKLQPTTPRQHPTCTGSRSMQRTASPLAPSQRKWFLGCLYHHVHVCIYIYIYICVYICIRSYIHMTYVKRYKSTTIDVAT